jgi:hypothetical protein
MSSIIQANGDSFHGISIGGRGVFTNNQYGGRTYAGQCKDGCACGLGVLTCSNGNKVYAEYGPDGWYDGRYLLRWSDGETTYRLFERGEPKAHADVYADVHCKYNGVVCAADDPRLLALIAQVAPVEVRPAAPAPTRHRPTLPRWISRLVLHPQALASTTTTEVHPLRCMPSLMTVRPKAYNSFSAKHDAVQSTTMP